MATDDDIQKMVSKETQSMAKAEVGINADLTDLRNITEALNKAKKEAKDLASSLGAAVKSMMRLKEMGLVQVYDESSYYAGSQNGGGGGGGGGQHTIGSTPVAGSRASHPAPVTPAPNAVAAAGGAPGGIAALQGFGGQFFKGAAGPFPGNIGGSPLGQGGTGLIGGMAQLGAGGVNRDNIGALIGSLGSQIVSAIDKRAEAGRGYSLAADKSTLVMQQLTGMSQSGVMNNLRMPLTQYKLGVNGINEMMDLQARTGINAAGQARSVEFMRTLSGFTMGAAGATSIIESLADPETVNKMFMMTGMSLVGPGGKQRSTQSLIENLAKRAGLTDPKLAATAMAPGSVSRATLSQMGVTGDMQEQVLRFAQSNAAFRKRGGKGTYDPTKEEDRKLMGIDDTFAMEAEETQRRRGKRDEQFYRDQADAYAKLERQTQRLTDTMAKFEHAMEGIIGARTGGRVGQKLLGGAAGAVGAGMLGFGAAALAAGTGGLGLIAGGAILGGLGRMFGDPNTSDDFASSIWTPRSSSSTVVGSSTATTPAGTPAIPVIADVPAAITPDPEAAPLQLWEAGQYDVFKTGLKSSFSNSFLQTQYSGKSEYTIKNSGEFNELNSELRKAINSMADRAMAEAGLDINLVSGRRSTDEQTKLFFERYQLAPPGVKEYKDSFDGKYYKVKSFFGSNWMKKPQNSDPPVAVPGTSLHEIGMAADIDMSDPKVAAWVRNNKWRFNLVNGEGEEHHLQLAWTKDMNLSQFLGKTGLSLEQANKNTHIAMQGTSRYTNSFRPGFGVDINRFSEALLRRWGYTITPEKIMLLRAWSDKEGTGGSYNPMNVISGNNRVDPNTGYDRPETNYNSNGGGMYPVQNFDSFEQGVEYTALHLGTNNQTLMGILSQSHPTVDQIRTVLSSVNRQTMLNIFNGYANRYQDSNYGIKELYNINGLDFGKKLGGYSGDPQKSTSGSTMSPISIPLSGSSTPVVGSSPVIQQGSTVTISPVINLNTTGVSGGVSEYDLRLMAKRIAKLIEQETNLDKIRRS